MSGAGGILDLRSRLLAVEETGGPVGPQGPASTVPGPSGPQGLPGADGLPGIQGIAGPQGVAGADGAQGLPGIQGLTGPAGPQGIQGLTGPQGIQGIQGPAGGGVTRAFGQLSSNYTLTSAVTVQKLFNWSASGAVTLATGRYAFTAKIYILGMSATSGNAAFSLAGTATLADRIMHVCGVDSTTPLVVGARGGSATITSATPASMVTAAVGTGLFAEIDGMFNVTVAGTVIPSIQLVTAAAAIVQAGSYFECERIADTGVNMIGTWT